MIGAALAGAGGSLLGNIISQGYDQMLRWNDLNWQSPFDATIALKDYDKDISDYFLDKQQAFEKNMSSTAYQRAVADMKAAGLNPAAMAGVNAQAASTPSPGSGYHSGSQEVSSGRYGSNFASNWFNSAVNAAISKDENVAKLLAAEIVDNAKHAHAMEELKEKSDLLRERDYYKFSLNRSESNSRSYKNSAQGDYYNEIVKSMRSKNNSSSGSKWLDNIKKK